MATRLQYLYCRICGARLKKDEVDEHEAQCLEQSETLTLLQEDPHQVSSEVTDKYDGTKTDGGGKTTKSHKSPIRKETISSTGDPAASPKRKAMLSIDKAKSPKNRAKPPEDQAKPPENQTKPPVDQAKPPENQTKPPVDQTKPSEDQTKPPENKANAPENKATSSGVQLRPPEDRTRSHKDQIKPTKDQTRPFKDTTKLPDDQTSPIRKLDAQDNSKEPRPSTSKNVEESVSNSFLAVLTSLQRPRSNSLPLNALLKDEPKQAWNANLPRRMSGRLSNPFPGSKKYRHYPVSCEFCNRKFQPGPLRKHIQKYHPDQHLPPSLRGKGKMAAPPSRDKRRETGARKKSPGGMPRQLKICYICGRLFGSKSLSIHESKCLEKWRVENERLPKSRRMPEPVKPVPLAVSDGGVLPGSGGGYSKGMPNLDPEAEAAYQSHLRNLIPCTHCGRTFNPDRVLRHENACVERPRRKQLKAMATA